MKYINPQLPHFIDFSVSGAKLPDPHLGQNLKTLAGLYLLLIPFQS
jgi:hypothetical protein